MTIDLKLLRRAIEYDASNAPALLIRSLAESRRVALDDIAVLRAQLDECKVAIQSISAMSHDNLLTFMKSTIEKESAERQERSAKKKLLMDNYTAIIRRLESWSPRYPYAHLKDEALRIIHSLLSHDCAAFDEPEPPEFTTEEWKEMYLSVKRHQQFTLERRIETVREHHDTQANWYKSLEESLQKL